MQVRLRNLVPPDLWITFRSSEIDLVEVNVGLAFHSASATSSPHQMYLVLGASYWCGVA